jgi:heavy metal sensor kinase
MRTISIGFRLTLWYTVIFATAEIIFGFGAWFVLRQDLYSITDNALRDQVEDLVHFLEAQKKNATIAKLQEEVSEAYVLEHSGDYLQIYDGRGEWIYRAAFLEQHPLSTREPGALKQTLYEDRRLADKLFRFITKRIEVNGRVYTVQSGLPAGQIVQVLSLFARYLVMLTPILLLAAAGGGYWLSRKALSPVDALVQTAQNISGSNLGDRLERLTTGDELQRLSDTLNQMLDRIEDAFRRVTQFTADASHELRTPISLIRAEAEIALRKSRSEEQYEEALRHILLEAERTSSLVEKLLSLARADSGRESLSMQPLDLRRMMTEAGAEWRPLLSVRSLEFRLRTTDQELMILGDPTALRRVWAILLDNAAKFTLPPGAVELSLEERDGRARISIRDTGIGIAGDDQSKIFERFYRADKARSREFGGAGLGLAIAQWIVRQHGGSIEVRSSLGKGSVFHVELPLPQLAPAPRPLHAEDQQPQTTL